VCNLGMKTSCKATTVGRTWDKRLTSQWIIRKYYCDGMDCSIRTQGSGHFLSVGLGAQVVLLLYKLTYEDCKHCLLLGVSCKILLLLPQLLAQLSALRFCRGITYEVIFSNFNQILHIDSARV
jgi:hypothetical protein